MISFKGAHFPKDIILYAVFFYVHYGVSYRDLEEIMVERGVKVDHATLNRWVIDYSPLIAAEAKKHKRPVASSWRMDEAGLICFIEICQVKYLNKLIEQDHRFIKKITKPMMGFKAFHSAQATIEGIETAHMIRKGQLSEENIPAYKQFMALAG